MKNTIVTCCIAILLALTTQTAYASLTKKPTPDTAIETQASRERVAVLVERLKHFKSLDKKTMSKAERKCYRLESIEAKKEIRQASGGVYISVGALILIIVLLIILL